MKKALALLLSLVMVFALAACSNDAGDNSGDNGGEQTVAQKVEASLENPVDTAKVKEAVDNGTFKVGFILLGDENEGYTYAHIEGIQAAIAALGLTDDQVIMKYNIPEDETCYDTAIDLVEQGCQMIFSNSFSHESYMVQAAAENPVFAGLADEPRFRKIVERLGRQEEI